MLKVCFMAVLSLNVVPHSIQDVASTARPAISNSTSTARADRGSPTFRNPTSLATSSSNVALLPSGKKVDKKRVVRGESADSDPSAHSRHYRVKAPPDLQTKSDMRILQYYAQPLDTIDLNVQPVGPYYDPLSGANAFSSANQNSLFVANSNYATAMPTLAPSGPPLHVPYKTLPQLEFGHAELAPKPFAVKHVNYQWNPEAHHLKPVPILDPFNVYKRGRPTKYRGGGAAHLHNLITAKPAPVSALPPVSVTHVYKYTDDGGGGGGLRLPFLHADDPLDDTIPILSAALDDHLRERVTSVAANSYLTPPKMGRPFLYDLPHIPLPPLDNELRLLDDYNAELRARIRQSAPAGDPADDGPPDEKRYTDDDVKKALEYIRNLKTKDKGKRSRGSKKYRGGGDDDDGDESAETKSSRSRKVNKHRQEEDEEEEEGGDGKRGGRRRKKPRKEHVFEEEEDFQLEPFEEDEKRRRESRKSEVEVDGRDGDDSLRSQESQIVPSVDDENAEFNFEGNVDIGHGDSDERVEFQMHGLKGPESYKFGYDTGKGYEERDPDGRVKGHFGYYDKDGKLQVFNYEADPETGYHLEKASE